MPLAVAISASFLSYTIPLGNFEFFTENQSPDVWDFFNINLYWVVWIIPSLSFRSIRTPVPR